MLKKVRFLDILHLKLAIFLFDIGDSDMITAVDDDQMSIKSCTHQYLFALSPIIIINNWYKVNLFLFADANQAHSGETGDNYDKHNENVY